MRHTKGTDSENYLRAPNLASCDRIGYPLSAMIAQVHSESHLMYNSFTFGRTNGRTRVIGSKRFKNSRKRERSDFWRLDPPLKGRCQTR
jgi:hypothetical protein